LRCNVLLGTLCEHLIGLASCHSSCAIFASASQPNNLIIGVGDDVREEWMEIVTPNYFSVLQVAPARGRGFIATSGAARAR
jgi:hypothetical protein